MEGTTHGVSGIVAGLGLGAAMDASPAVCGLLAGVSFLGAFVPDIDHRQSTVTRLVPILGPAASFVMRKASREVYAATKGPADEPWTGEHRHLTHTGVFAAAFGALVGFGTLIGAERVGVDHPQHLAWLVGLAMALGCITHCLGDSLTLMGCPWLWPLPIAGETWYELRLPRGLRFRTGGLVERFIVLPALTIAAFLLIPGAWPTVLSLVIHASHAAATTQP